MGLLDSVIGAAIGQATSGAGGGGAGGLEALGGLGGMGGMGSLLGEGGLAGLVQKFQQAGLGEVVASWIATGPNLPISAEQLQAVLGSDAVRGMAQQAGIDPQALLGQLSQLLPGLVDQLTPEGQLPQGGQLSPAGLNNLAGMLGGLMKG